MPLLTLSFRETPGCMRKKRRDPFLNSGKYKQCNRHSRFSRGTGYDDKAVSNYGFTNLTDFARYIFDSLDLVSSPPGSDRVEQLTISPKRKRLWNKIP